MLHFLNRIWEGKHKTGRTRCKKNHTRGWENLFQFLVGLTPMVNLCS